VFAPQVRRPTGQRVAPAQRNEEARVEVGQRTAGDGAVGAKLADVPQTEQILVEPSAAGEVGDRNGGLDNSPNAGSSHREIT
jgi:hypothetical protein